MNNSNIRFSNPIEYVLNQMLSGLKVETFDIRNATDQWNQIKNIQPVAYTLDNGDGNIYNISKYDNPYIDRNRVVKLYRHD